MFNILHTPAAIHGQGHRAKLNVLTGSIWNEELLHLEYLAFTAFLRSFTSQTNCLHGFDGKFFSFEVGIRPIFIRKKIDDAKLSFTLNKPLIFLLDKYAGVAFP